MIGITDTCILHNFSSTLKSPEFELACYDLADQYVSHYTTRNSFEGSEVGVFCKPQKYFARFRNILFLSLSLSLSLSLYLYIYIYTYINLLCLCLCLSVCLSVFLSVAVNAERRSVVSQKAKKCLLMPIVYFFLLLRTHWLGG